MMARPQQQAMNRDCRQHGDGKVERIWQQKTEQKEAMRMSKNKQEPERFQYLAAITAHHSCFIQAS